MIFALLLAQNFRTKTFDRATKFTFRMSVEDRSLPARARELDSVGEELSFTVSHPYMMKRRRSCDFEC